MRPVRLGSAASADQEVELILLAQDEVLEEMLERLGDALAAGGLDCRLQRLDGVLLGIDQPVDDFLGLLCPLERSDIRCGLAAEGRDLLDEMPGVVDLRRPNSAS